MNERSHIQKLSQRMLRQPRPIDVGREGIAERADAERIVGERYRLGARIGRGRLGHIYEASEEAVAGIEDARQVAIQLLDLDVASNQSRIDELRRGFAALRGARHPNIVEIFDFGRDGKRLFVAMELLEGVSLRQVLADTTTLPVSETIAVIFAVGDALKYLHAKALVHGRLRAESVFVTFDYVVKLLDVAPLGRRSSGPYYVEDMEQRGPVALDKRDDVYGLACLTYELLSGRHPFNANSPLEAYRAGLKPPPIDALTVRQWQALTRALSLLSI
jgi:serine/threonine protein kinase